MCTFKLKPLNFFKIYGIIKGKESVYIFRLFDTSITLPHEDVIVSYTCKMADTTNCDMFLKLEVQAEDGSNQVWILREKEISKPQPNMTVYTPTEMVKDLPNATVSTTNGWATWYAFYFFLHIYKEFEYLLYMESPACVFMLTKLRNLFFDELM